MYNSAALGEYFTPEQLSQLDLLINHMLEYNENVNLTAITDIDGINAKHIVDSILPLKLIDVPRGTKVLDIGTGAGFPALPMKIIRPDLKFTLMDSLRKRIDYLSTVDELLSLDNELIHGRAEEYGRKAQYRETYGMVTARAVASMPVLSEYAIPFLEIGGIFVAMKSVNESIDEALPLIERLGGAYDKTIDYELPNGDKRRIIIIKKIKATPDKYPRAGGKAGKI